jgi:hypothetical protein
MHNFSVAGSAVLAAIFLTAAYASAAAPASYDGASKVIVRNSSNYEIARGGCGSKGGPGYRKSNGKCASWRD